MVSGKENEKSVAVTATVGMDGSFSPQATSANIVRRPTTDERKTRGYRLLEEMNTKPNVIYLKKVDLNKAEDHG